MLLGVHLCGERSYEAIRTHPALGFNKKHHTYVPFKKRVRKRPGARNRKPSEAEQAANPPVANDVPDDGKNRKWPSSGNLFKRFRALVAVLTKYLRQKQTGDGPRRRRETMTAEQKEAKKVELEKTFNKKQIKSFKNLVLAWGLPPIKPANLSPQLANDPLLWQCGEMRVAVREQSVADLLALIASVCFQIGISSNATRTCRRRRSRAFSSSPIASSVTARRFST